MTISHIAFILNSMAIGCSKCLNERNEPAINQLLSSLIIILTDGAKACESIAKANENDN